MLKKAVKYFLMFVLALVGFLAAGVVVWALSGLVGVVVVGLLYPNLLETTPAPFWIGVLMVFCVTGWATHVHFILKGVGKWLLFLIGRGDCFEGSK